MKKCSGCQETKSLAGFGKQTGGRDGLKAQCKVCRAAATRAWYAANTEKASATSRKYYAANLEKSLVTNRRWREANPDKARAIVRKWYVANPEKALANTRKWRAANPEKARATTRRRYAANPEVFLLQGQRRRARKLANGIFKITAKETKRMLSQPCYLCGVAPSTAIDHIIPITRDGQHSIGNLLGACRSCNASKHNKLLIEYRSSHKGELCLSGS